MAKRLCGAKVLEMMANVDTSMEEDSSEDDTVDGHSSNVDSSEEDMEVSDAASEGDEPWNKVTGIVPNFPTLPFTVPETGFSLRGDRKTPGCRRCTNFHCKTCPRQTGLHPDACFEKYHPQVDFK